MSKEKYGKVTLVGAGPGDIGLLTRKGMQAIEEAEVLVTRVSMVLIICLIKN